MWCCSISHGVEGSVAALTVFRTRVILLEKKIKVGEGRRREEKIATSIDLNPLLKRTRNG
jgi:hypothetical protein